MKLKKVSTFQTQDGELFQDKKEAQVHEICNEIRKAFDVKDKEAHIKFHDSELEEKIMEILNQ